MWVGLIQSVEGFRRKKKEVPWGRENPASRLFQAPKSSISSFPSLQPASLPCRYSTWSLHSCVRRLVKINLSPSIYIHTSYWFYLQYKSLPLTQKRTTWLRGWEAALLLAWRPRQPRIHHHLAVTLTPGQKWWRRRHWRCQGPGWIGCCGSCDLDLRPRSSKAWSSLGVHLEAERPAGARKCRECYNCGITNKKTSCRVENIFLGL